MAIFFDQLKGILPAVYREDKSAKVQSGQIAKKDTLFKVDGRFTRWLRYYFDRKRWKSKGWFYYLMKDRR